MSARALENSALPQRLEVAAPRSSAPKTDIQTSRRLGTHPELKFRNGDLSQVAGGWRAENRRGHGLQTDA